MILYHYTALEYVESILQSGLTRGEVPLGPGREDCLNAVWFTSDADPAGHGLTDGKVLSTDEKRILGVDVATEFRFPDKRRIRIAVDIDANDQNMSRWMRWAKKRVDPAWLKTLHRTAGGDKKARTWYLYWGTIPSTSFSEVLDLDTGENYLRSR